MAGDPLQLPPTVISSNEKKPETKAVKGAVAKKTTVDKSKGKQVAKISSPAGNDLSGSHSEQESDQDVGASFDRAVVAKRSGALIPPKSLETTLFDRMEAMWGDGVKQMLNVQYR